MPYIEGVKILFWAYLWVTFKIVFIVLLKLAVRCFQKNNSKNRLKCALDRLLKREKAEANSIIKFKQLLSLWGGSCLLNYYLVANLI